MGRLNANIMPLYKQNQSCKDMKGQILYVGFFASAGLYSYFHLLNKKECYVDTLWKILPLAHNPAQISWVVMMIKKKKNNVKTIGEHFYNLGAVSQKINRFNSIKLKNQQIGENICNKYNKK